MQHRAQNLLHCISLRADTHTHCGFFPAYRQQCLDVKHKILERDLRRRPSLGSPWPSCWCHGPASGSSTPRRVSHSGGEKQK